MYSMPPWELIIAVVAAVLGSSGLWAFVTTVKDRKSGNTRILLGLAHDRIMYLGGHYIKRGYITQDEYENLHNYIFAPYAARGGNGAAARIMKEVDKLPIYDRHLPPKGDN
jgi:hypothetical protein